MRIARVKCFQLPKNLFGRFQKRFSCTSTNSNCASPCRDADRPSGASLASSRSRMLDLIKSTPPNSTLKGELYYDRIFYELELQNIWYKEWIFAGHTFDVPNPGDWMVLQLGEYPLVIVRDRNGKINCFHNVCRHRGFKLVQSDEVSNQNKLAYDRINTQFGQHCKGSVARRFVCPYHQWTFELDGTLAFAKDAPSKQENPNFINNNSLLPVHLESVGGYLFVCVNPNPPSFQEFKKQFEPYISPYNFEKGAKVAFSSSIIEAANWKLVWENNRECYHCKGSHPELGVTFPADPSWNGVHATPKQKKELEAFHQNAKDLGLSSDYVIDPKPGPQWRLMRMPFVGTGVSMTMDGKPAVKDKSFIANFPANQNIGDVLCFHYPNTWNHWQADYALSFRLLPVSPTETQLVTKWIVPKDAVEGKDYDLETLTNVWLATNNQDRLLVQRQQEGVSSPAYVPGTYNTLHEDGVAQFIEWYLHNIKPSLSN